MTKRDEKRVARLVDFLSQKNITTIQGCWAAFKHFLAQGAVQKSQKQWFTALTFVKQVKDYRIFYEDSLRVFEASEVSIGIEDFIFYVVEENLDTKLHAGVRYELRLDYALRLFASENHKDLIHEILKQQFEANKDDERVWLPLFFLQSSLNQHYDRYDLLKFIIPRIANKQEILNSYPLTLESLEKEFKKVSSLLNLPSTIPTYVSSLEDASSRVSQAERNLIEQSHSIEIPNLTDFRFAVKDTSQANQAAKKVSQPAKRDSTLKSMGATSRQSSIPPVPVKTLNDSGVSWRSIAASLIARKGDSERVSFQDYETREEKHLALQFTSLIEGRLDILDKWEHKVWKDVSSYFYNPVERMDDSIKLTSLRQPLHQVILLLRHFLEQMHHSYFT